MPDSDKQPVADEEMALEDGAPGCRERRADQNRRLGAERVDQRVDHRADVALRASSSKVEQYLK